MRYFLGVLVALTLATPARSDFDDGMAAYQRGDYATALHEWRPLAEQGDASAQYNLGQMHHNGDGVPQDDSEAKKWYHKAAEQGYAEAEHALGNMYIFDDPAGAIKWYRKAAERGYRDAWAALAIEYLAGFSVPQDYAEAAKWIRKLADQDEPSYQVELGKMYQKGQGVPQDYVQAYMWFRLALEWGTGTKNLDRIADEMTPEDVSKAKRLAREWLEKHGR